MTTTLEVTPPSLAGGAASGGPAIPEGPAERWTLGGRQFELDGLVWVGVRSTGIYCRPVCPARSPLLRNVEPLRSAAEAVARGYRACRRCRPHEAAPWAAPLGGDQRVRGAYRALLHGDVDDEPSAWGDAFGATFAEVSRQCRLDLALQLLTGGVLADAQIAAMVDLGVDDLVAGIEETTRRAPAEHRRKRPEASAGPRVEIVLAYRPPFAWERLLEFLSGRAVAPFEEVVLPDSAQGEAGLWRRRATVAGTKSGVVAVEIEVRDEPQRHRLRVAIEWSAGGGEPLLLPIVGRLVDVFDLTADPAAAEEALAGSEMASLVARQRGIRVPGCWDPFEMLLRAILGQQVTVRGANTLATRLVDRFGNAQDPPTPEMLCAVAAGEVAQEIGLPEARARCIRGVAEACATTLDLSPGGVARAGVEAVAKQLLALPGIGPWTVDYLRLRALGERDVLLAGDLVARRRAAVVFGRSEAALSEKQLRSSALRWSPARSTAQMLLWQEVSD